MPVCIFWLFHIFFLSVEHPNEHNSNDTRRKCLYGICKLGTYVQDLRWFGQFYVLLNQTGKKGFVQSGDRRIVCLFQTVCQLISHLYNATKHLLQLLNRNPIRVPNYTQAQHLCVFSECTRNPKATKCSPNTATWIAIIPSGRILLCCETLRGTLVRSRFVLSELCKDFHHGSPETLLVASTLAQHCAARTRIEETCNNKFNRRCLIKIAAHVTQTTWFKVRYMTGVTARVERFRAAHFTNQSEWDCPRELMEPRHIVSCAIIRVWQHVASQTIPRDCSGCVFKCHWACQFELVRSNGCGHVFLFVSRNQKQVAYYGTRTWSRTLTARHKINYRTFAFGSRMQCVRSRASEQHHKSRIENEMLGHHLFGVSV